MARPCSLDTVKIAEQQIHCVAGDGYVVVGSQDGQIRLYNGKQFTRANTAVPGLGAPITSVDVTYDGKWILATTKSYLMVVKTIYKVSAFIIDYMHA